MKHTEKNFGAYMTALFIIGACISAIVMTLIILEIQEQREWENAHPCISSHEETRHQPQITTYIKVGNVMVPSTTGGYDYTVTVCDERKGIEK
jgi:hypothetical protein